MSATPTQIRVRPGKGRRVRDLAGTGQPIPEEGGLVTLDTYVRCKIADGDLEQIDDEGHPVAKPDAEAALGHAPAEEAPAGGAGGRGRRGAASE